MTKIMTAIVIAEKCNMQDIVTIESKDISKIINDLKLDVDVKDKNVIRFKNKLSSDKLIKSLSKYKIDKILIEEATLEDVFLHYYK